MNRITHWINGETIGGNGATLPVFDPATGQQTSEVEVADRDLVARAVASARSAAVAWSAEPAVKRARVMFRYRELLEQHAEEICRLIAAEHGKIGHDARGELQRGIENVEFACGAPQLLKGEHSREVAPGIDSWSEFHPVGVVAGITPFNFPVMVPLWMIPIALVCGNSFVLKPSERDPSPALLAAELLHEAGLPPGVLNVINGDRSTVDALLEDPHIDAVSFVGSTPVAEHVFRTATAAGKRCQALGGAKNHAIVLPDADLDNAVAQLLGAAFGSSGERCMALSVVVAVGDDTADALVQRLAAAMQNLSVGPASDASNDFGPLITQQHLERVQQAIVSGEEEGAEVVVDGRAAEAARDHSGFFLGATLVDRVRTDMASYQQEIFGPVLQVVRTRSMQEAMELVDRNAYGNGTCIFTRDGEAARYFAQHIRVGMVGINVPLPVPVAYHSFGGWKRSLFGDLAAYGPDAVRFYTRRKTITQRWPSAGVREGAKFSMPHSG